MEEQGTCIPDHVEQIAQATNRIFALLRLVANDDLFEVMLPTLMEIDMNNECIANAAGFEIHTVDGEILVTAAGDGEAE